MRADIEAMLARYDERWSRELQVMRNTPPGEMLALRDTLLLSVGRESATFLNILAKEARAKVILEVGASYGYSTIWLAEAADAVGGTVISLEIDPAKHDFTRRSLAELGLDHRVELVTGDALQTIAGLDRKFDLVLLDPWKDLYIPAFDLFYPKLNDGALIVADNMLQPEPLEAAKYRAHIKDKPGITSVLLPIGTGLEVSRYKGG